MATNPGKNKSAEEAARSQLLKHALLAESEACMKAFYYLEMSVVRSDDSFLSEAAKKLGQELQCRAFELKNRASEI